MKKIILIAACLLCRCYANAQYGIGDKLPDTSLDTIINYTKSTARLSEFSGKPLILSFWFQHCTVCMATFRQMDSLQKKYGSKLNFLAVTSDDATATRKFFAQYPLLRQMKIPSVTSDTLLHKWIPHRTEPHVVWLNSNRIIQAITGHSELTPQNLNTLISGKHLDLKLKAEEEDSRKFWAIDPVILNNYEENKSRLLNYSYISTFREGLVTQGGVARKQGDYYRTACINLDLQHLYIAAYDKLGLHHTLIFFDEADKYRPDYQTKENLFCYDALIKAKTREEARLKMQTDLDLYFGFKSYLKVKKARYFTLEVIDSSLVNRPLPQDDSTLHAEESKHITRKKMSIMALVDNYLNQLPLEVLNKTTIKGFIEIAFPDDKTNVDAIKKSLEQKGLILVERLADIECLIIEKKSS